MLLWRNWAGGARIFIRGVVVQHGPRERNTWSSRQFRGSSIFPREDWPFAAKGFFINYHVPLCAKHVVHPSSPCTCHSVNCAPCHSHGICKRHTHKSEVSASANHMDQQAHFGSGKGVLVLAALSSHSGQFSGSFH